MRALAAQVEAAEDASRHPYTEGHRAVLYIT
jgi:hypothetical protein